MQNEERDLVYGGQSEARGVVYIKGFWVEITYLFSKTSVGIKCMCCKGVHLTLG